MTDKDLYGGLIRLHILHHAAEASIFGLAIIEELRHHGYELSAGTHIRCCTVWKRKVICARTMSLPGAVSDACTRLPMKAESRWRMQSLNQLCMGTIRLEDCLTSSSTL